MPRAPGWKVLASLITLTTINYAVRSRRSHGTFLNVPYDFRPPTL